MIIFGWKAQTVLIGVLTAMCGNCRPGRARYLAA
jgi:hypothetical protein